MIFFPLFMLSKWTTSDLAVSVDHGRLDYLQRDASMPSKGCGHCRERALSPQQPSRGWVVYGMNVGQFMAHGYGSCWCGIKAGWSCGSENWTRSEYHSWLCRGSQFANSVICSEMLSPQNTTGVQWELSTSENFCNSSVKWGHSCFPASPESSEV